MQPYPKTISPDIESVTDALRAISRIREEDITDRNTFPSIFMKGRKVGKIPANSADVAATDRLGDFSFDTSYFYLFVGTAWRRSALASW